MTTDASRTLTITVEGMHCDNCAQKVRTALEQVPGVSGAEVSAAGKSARVTFDPARAGTPALMAAVRTAGFIPTGFGKA